MKICVSSYSFQPMLKSGEISQFGLIKKVKEMGFDGIEFTDLSPENGLSEREYAQMLREESERLNLPIVNYTIGAELINRPLDEECERLFGKVDVAAILGASGMRHDATGGFEGAKGRFCGFDQALPTLIEGCRRVTEYAAEKGVSTMVENHGFFAQDSDRVEKLVTGVANENFGLLVDIGNFACADDPSDKAVGRVAKYAKYVHVKDFHIKSGSEPDPGRGFFRSRAGNYLRGAIIGHGNIPVAQCIGILKRAGYDGYVSIEFEGIEQTLKGIEIGLENLRRYVAAAK